MTSTPRTIRVGTRGSQLATTQTRLVAEALTAASGIPHELVPIRSHGDANRASLSSLGGIGVFAAALRLAILDGEVDIAVHSLKDLPTAPVPGLAIHAIPPREDPRDALCARDGLTLETLPPGARVGTGSPRRIAQLRRARPDLEFIDLRGNVPTRLRTVTDGELDAVVLAASGLARLDLLDAATELLEPEVVLPAPGQGALAVEAREDLAETWPELAAALAALDDGPTRLAVSAERAVLAELEAGCATPVGALAALNEESAGGDGDDTPDRTARTLVMLARSSDGERIAEAPVQAPLPGGEFDRETALVGWQFAVALGVRAGRSLREQGADAFEVAASPRRGVLDAGGADDVTGDGAAPTTPDGPGSPDTPENPARP